MNGYPALLAGLVCLVHSSALAQVLLDESGEFGPEPSSEVRHFTVEVEDVANVAVLATTVKLTQGKVALRSTDPEGRLVVDVATRGFMRVERKRLSISGRTGVYHVEVVPYKAVGTWSVCVSTERESWQFAWLMIPGMGMMIVGVGAVFLWRRWSGAKWRWFWAGAAVWTVGVFLKFAWAIPLNKPLLEALEARTSGSVYFTLGSLYVGLLTGVFEIGITLAAALVWRKMAQNASRGVAVGVGAGAFEALVLGAVTVSSVVAGIAWGGHLRHELAVSAEAAMTISLFWLVAPVERIIVVLCHTSSRALVLIGVARGRWLWPFLGGFLVLTAIDSVAGYAHLAGSMGRGSPWWLELAVAPVALLSIPILFWCIRNWPDVQKAAPVAAAGCGSRSSAVGMEEPIAPAARERKRSTE